jgi:hypothetical protein
MQTPPPFHGYEGMPQPPKRKNNTVVILLAVLGGLLICCGLPMGIVGYFGFKGFKGAMQIGGCVANVNMMKQALRDYSAAHDGKLPSAKNWQAEIGKYLVATKDMDSAPMTFWKAGGEWSCEDNGIKTGFMFNQALSEKKVSDAIKADPDAIAIFETKSVAFNQSGPIVKLPFAESPKVFGEFTDKRRGWLLVDAQGANVYTYNVKGKRVPFTIDDMNMKSSKKGGFNISIDSNSTSDDSKDSKDSTDSNDSKEDNSN